MKWFKIEFQTTVNGEQETVTPLVSEGMSQEDAVTDFHTAMASLRASVDAKTLTEATCMVVNSWGGVDEDHCETYTGKPVTQT